MVHPPLSVGEKASLVFNALVICKLHAPEGPSSASLTVLGHPQAQFT